jgi:hypothetical protein
MPCYLTDGVTASDLSERCRVCAYVRRIWKIDSAIMYHCRAKCNCSVIVVSHGPAQAIKLKNRQKRKLLMCCVQ